MEKHFDTIFLFLHSYFQAMIKTKIILSEKQLLKTLTVIQQSVSENPFLGFSLKKEIIDCLLEPLLFNSRMVSQVLHRDCQQQHIF